MGKKNKMKKKNEPQEGCGQNKLFVAADDTEFSFWAIFCYPYKICSKLCDCCGSVCTATNQFVIFAMMVQWCICRLSRLTNPDPCICPYYFFMFCQLLVMTGVFALFWYIFGKPIALPFLHAVFETYSSGDFKPKPKNFTRLSFRKYCFRKSELFETPPPPKTSSAFQFHPIMVITFVIEGFVNGIK